MEFMNALQNTVQEKDKTSYTENGMPGYASTQHPLVDFFFKVASYRGCSEEEIIKDFDKILASTTDAPYALRLLFYIRDVRNGLGERRLFRVCFKHLLNAIPRLWENKSLLRMIPEYGRWDDLFVLLDTDTSNTSYNGIILEIISKQLSYDIYDMSNKTLKNTNVSLLAKWMPSENASSKETRALARMFAHELRLTPREYRKTLSDLRKYLKVIETYTCSNRWNEIDYNAVPSKANLKYANAFMKHDEARRKEYLEALAKGSKSVKINSSVNYPHEIVYKYKIGIKHGNYYDETLEQLWQNLKQMPGLDNTLIVRDGSGSMDCGCISNTSCTALDVADGLSIYCSERCNDAFKDKFITFSSRPQLVDLSKYDSLEDKLERLQSFDDCSNTDIDKVFKLVLQTAIDNHLTQEQLPKQIVIISDMEFDVSTNYLGSNPIETAQVEYQNYGYQVPKLIFWNVNSRTGTIPVKQNELGVYLVSGFSVNILEMFASDTLDPFDAILEQLNKYKDNIPLL